MKFLLMVAIAAVWLFADTKKIVFDLTTGDIETFQTRFLTGAPSTIDYFQKQGDTVKAAVIVHGNAYKFFVDHLENTKYGIDANLSARQEDLHRRLEEMSRKYGIVIEVCQAGMARNGILKEDLYPFAGTVRSAMVGLVRWQSEGYAYIPIP